MPSTKAGACRLIGFSISFVLVMQAADRDLYNGPMHPENLYDPCLRVLTKSSQSESAVRTSFALLAGSALAALKV